jgi:hypothetical protein
MFSDPIPNASGSVDLSPTPPDASIDGLLWRNPAGALYVSVSGAWMPIAGGGGGGGAGLPVASKANQVLVSAGLTPFPWTPQDSLDSGRF